MRDHTRYVSMHGALRLTRTEALVLIKDAGETLVPAAHRAIIKLRRALALHDSLRSRGIGFRRARNLRGTGPVAAPAKEGA